MNKYDKEFENIFNQTALFSKMWELFDTHPEDKKEIYEQDILENREKIENKINRNKN